MKRSTILTIAAVAAVGAGLGVLIAPGTLELAVMQVRDANFSGATAAFEDRYAKGDHSREVVATLSDLYLRSGNVDGAVAILLDYANEHPDDREVDARLANLLTDAQRVDDSIAAYERLAKVSPDPTTLHRLARLYDFAGRPTQYRDMLHRLVQSNEATFPEHLEVADLLAGAARKEEALAVLYNAAQRFPDQINDDFVTFFAALAFDLGRADLALQLADYHQQRHPDAAQFIELVGLFRSLRQPGAALAFARMQRTRFADDPAVMIAILSTEADLGDARAAFAGIRVLRDAGQLNAAGAALFVELGLRYGATRDAYETALLGGFTTLPYWLQSSIVTRAKGDGATAFLRSALATLGAQGAARQPALAGRIALAMGDRALAATYAAVAEAEPGAPAMQFDLVQLYRELGEETAAQAAVRRIAASLDDLSAAELKPFVLMAAELKDGALALAAADRLVALDGGPAALALRARALAVAGRAQEALDILETLDLSSEVAEDAYLGALKALGRRERLQAHLYRRLIDMSVSPGRRLSLIYALKESGPPFAAGAARVASSLVKELEDASIAGEAREARVLLLVELDPAQGLALLAELAEREPRRLGPDYLEALKRAGRKDEAIAYIDRVLPQLTDGPLSDGFVYALVDLGAGERVLPYLAERARSRGGDWSAAYADALKRLGRRDELVAFLNDEAAQPNRTADALRAIGFLLLDVGARDDAERLFRSLAIQNGPASPDAQQLLFIWGPRPSADRVQWLVERVRGAVGAQKTQWLTHLGNTDANEAAATEALIVLENVYDPAVAAIAGEALVALRDKARLAQVLAAVRKAERDPKRLLAFAQSAEALALTDDALALFEASAAAGNVEALAGAGRAALAGGRLSRAIELFAQYFDTGGRSFVARHAYGDALSGAQRRDAALRQYAFALEGARAEPAAAESLRVRVLCLIRLGRIAEAKPLIREVLAARAGDTALRADVASALIDAKELDLAERVLNSGT